MRDSKPIKRFDAGQPIRFKPVTESELVPLDVNGWLKEFYAVPEDFDGGIMKCCDLPAGHDHKHKSN